MESKHYKFGRDNEDLFIKRIVQDIFAPELRDLLRLSAYMELVSFDKNRIKLNKIELFNLN